MLALNFLGHSTQQFCQLSMFYFIHKVFAFEIKAIIYLFVWQCLPNIRESGIIFTKDF
jgi:hypothetical protein